MKKFIALLLLISCARAPQEAPPSFRKPPSHIQKVDRQKVTITLDAGHGGKDPGTQSANKIYQEKNLTLATTLMVQKHLEEMGYKIHLTRTSDETLLLTDRSKFANAQKSDLFVSIHYNHSDSPKARGIEVFTFKTEDKEKQATEAKKLASSVLGKLTGYTAAPSRGVKEANFSVLRRTEMPAILIEGGFLSNEEELQYLTDPKYLNTIAWGIAQGIDDYVAKRQ